MRTAPRRPRRAASGRPPEASCRRRAPDLQPGRSVPSRPADAQSSSSNGTGRRVRMKTRCPSTTKSVHRVSGISVDELRSLSSKLISHGRAPETGRRREAGWSGSCQPPGVGELSSPDGGKAAAGVIGRLRSLPARVRSPIGEPSTERRRRRAAARSEPARPVPEGRRCQALATCASQRKRRVAILSPASPRSQAPRCCRPRAPCPLGPRP